MLVGGRLTYNLLFELVAQAFEFERSTYAEQYARGACKDVERLSALSLGILATYEGHCRMGAATHHILNLLGLGRVESDAEDVAQDMLVHIVELALAV